MAQKRQSDRLWKVTIKNEKGIANTAVFTDLLILATDTEVASRKAQRWLKRNAFTGMAIKSVENQGTIDVF